MSLGLVGRKVGMTRIFTDDGVSVPVTVLDVSNNRVAQIKTQQNDGYSVVQVAFGKRRPSRAVSYTHLTLPSRRVTISASPSFPSDKRLT